MLKITALNCGDQRRLVLEGALVEPWISELERSWAEAQAAGNTSKVIVDLKDVIAISERGEDLLSQMMAEGAKFQCCRGVLTKHVIQQLERKCKARKGKGEINHESKLANQD
jgi:hypothetical protein